MGYIYYTSNPAGMQSKAPRQPKVTEFLAEVVASVTATTSGLVFFAIDKPLVLEHEVAFKLIRRLHA